MSAAPLLALGTAAGLVLAGLLLRCDQPRVPGEPLLRDVGDCRCVGRVHVCDSLGCLHGGSDGPRTHVTGSVSDDGAAGVPVGDEEGA